MIHKYYEQIIIINKESVMTRQEDHISCELKHMAYCIDVVHSSITADGSAVVRVVPKLQY